MKNIILSFFVGLIIGCISAALFNAFDVDSEASIPNTNFNELQKEAVKTETFYQKKIDSLKARSVGLNTALKGTKAELNKAKQKNNSLQTAIYQLLEKQYEGGGDSTGSEQDYSCDSLKDTVKNLMEVSTQKDSLYEMVTQNLEEQLTLKDSSNAFKDQEFSKLKESFSESISQANSLFEQNKLLQKLLKKQKAKSRVVSGLLLVIVGAAANYLIHK
jgi:hypothetical protein